MSRLTIIVAATKTNGIGVNGSLPWRLPKELKYFSDATTSSGSVNVVNAGDPTATPNVVIMGRKSWESIPRKRRPLPRRFNVVISRDAGYDLGTNSESAILKDSLKSAFALLPSLSPSPSPSTAPRAFIIGGATLYTESLALPPSPSAPYVDRVLLTRINEPAFECDVFMPDFTAAAGAGGNGEGIGEGNGGWRRETHEALRRWVGFEVPEGEQEEGGVKYEFQMWVRD